MSRLRVNIIPPGRPATPTIKGVILQSLAMDDYLSDSSGLSSPPASPCTPAGFPSPPPSQDSDEPRAELCQDDVPPPKKRRRVSPKERTTQRLYLSPSAGISRSEQQAQIDLLKKTIHGHRKIIVVAGAGISTNAGSTFQTNSACFLTPMMLTSQ